VIAFFAVNARYNAACNIQHLNGLLASRAEFRHEFLKKLRCGFDSSRVVRKFDTFQIGKCAVVFCDVEIVTVHGSGREIVGGYAPYTRDKFARYVV